MPKHVDVSALIRFHYIASHKLILLQALVLECARNVLPKELDV